ncbi:hypothetical protein [Nocardioides marmoriginsengisoli]|nr:hypothetical protein [Nocardioides marmoriginsengisoli]
MPDRQGWVAIADGDEVGALLDTFATVNDLDGLVRTSRQIDSDREHLSRWFIDLGATVALTVADTVIASGGGEPPGAAQYPSFDPTWSVGVGVDIAGARAALAVAKALGRNRVIDGRRWQVD